jgi:PPOX class probable F420-dependent enzyme
MIPDDYMDLVEEPHIGVLTTVSPEGVPLGTPVWFDYKKDKQVLRFNTAKGRTKHKFIDNHKEVAMTIMDRDNPYRYLMIQGIVTDITEDGAEAHVHQLARRYTDQEEYPIQKGNTRLKFVIQPENVITWG